MGRKIRIPRFPMAAAAALLSLLGGCEPVSLAVGAGAATGVAAYQERGIEGVAADTRIEARILKSWYDHDKALPTRVSVEVYEGRALLTGIVAKERDRADAVRLAWAAEGVVDVLNEIVVGDGGGISMLARDSAITAELKSKLTFDEKVLAVNYSIETVAGTVYLIGIAQSQAELDRVVARARDTEYVHRVISHVRVKAPAKKGAGP